jgi:hypothetical protein
MSEKIKVVIDRSKWRTGLYSKNRTGKSPVRLLNQEGFMCCLGFICKAAGVSEDNLLNVDAPGDFNSSIKEQSPRLQTLLNPDSVSGNSLLTHKAIGINDCGLSSPGKKEQNLLELFKDSEFELEFTGEYQEKSND